VINCGKCGRENRQGRRFCAGCGTALELKCPQCGASNEPDEYYCGQCGFALVLGSGSAAEQQPPPAVRIVAENSEVQPLDGERKTVTALFADIKGSMELMEDLDPEDARAIIDPALKLMIDAVHRYDGYIVQSTGDGIFALFGAPVAHEDHPQRALHAALRMQEEMRRYGDRMRSQGQTPLQVRIGVNTGEVVVRSIQTGADHTEYTPIGHSTGLAARLQTLATPGTTMISGSTRRLVEGFFQLKSFGPTRLKGVTEQVEVYEVTGLGPLRTRLQRAAARGLTKFVGRQHEMEALKYAAEQAQAGHGQIVAVMGDPGVGKSRLYYEFKAVSQSGWMVLEAFSVSHGKASAYLPVLDLLSQYFEISRDDDDRKRRERVLGKVLGLDRTLEDTLPYLYSLQGVTDTGDSLAQMDPQIRRRRTLEAIKRILLRESLNQPLIAIFEDLHWIDSETQALLNLLVDAIANARILLLVNYRPEYRHDWGSRTHYTQLRLDPLGRESAAEMLAALLGDEPELEPLKHLIADRTEGNPFFVEEMVQALFEQGVLVRNGKVNLKQSLAEIKIPPTVQALLASRIDRLPPDQKELLQTLAVMGREFMLTLVQRVTLRSSDELEQMLAQLQLGDFIYEQPAVDEIEYTFKHALTQEVTYNSLLVERRRAIHEKIANAIEALVSERLEDHYTELAYHFLRSPDAAKAIRYAHLAADQALKRAAYSEAGNLIEAALKLLDRLFERTERLHAEFALRRIENTLAFALLGGGSQERARAVRRMCELGEKIGEKGQLLLGLTELCQLHFVRGEASEGLELAIRCLALAEDKHDPLSLALASHYVALLAHSCGNLRQAVSQFQDAMRNADRANVDVLQIGLLFDTAVAWVLTLDLHLLGRVGEALKVTEQGLRNVRESRHLFSLSFALCFPWLRQFRREPEIALACAEEAISLCDQNGFAVWLAWARFTRGWALAELGQVAQGVVEMEAAILNFRRMGGVPHLPYAIALVASSYATMGQTEKGLALLNESLALIERGGEKIEKAEILRLKGEVLLMHDSTKTAEAEACCRAALDMARAQEAKWWELRTSVSLARLLRDNSRPDEARTMLGEIYNWFTEGFDTPDLKDAKALLEELT
jgi:class 3 adenylate cyclase/tetratricopeptide (TPR) repeat protein